MTEIAVLHLARGSNDRAHLERFLESYRVIPAGIAHRLIVVMKGYHGQEARFAEDTELARHAGGEILHLDRDDRFDIGAYQEAASRIQASHYCFVNSFSRVLLPHWLARLHEAIQQKDVGISGASGSWQSPPASEFRRFRMQQGVRHGVRGVALMPYFPLFPNPHVRTNGFLVSRETLRAIVFPRRWTKKMMWRFESGRNGLTAQICARGLRAIIATGTGFFDVAEWPRTRGFVSGDQQDLLIADNQTDHYARASEDERRWLTLTAWGST